MERALRIWALLALLALLAFALALSAGSAALSPLRIPGWLLAPDGSVGAEVLHRLRLPRALAAFGTGGLLALAGALMQVLLRNPLADPYVLGVSGGAGVGALGAMLLGLSAWLVQAGAFAGALLAVLLVFVIAQRDLGRLAAPGSRDGAPRLLLAGVMLASLWAALIALMLTLAPQARLRGMLFWLTGDLGASDASWGPLLALALLVVAVLPTARSLNVLLRGEAVAHTLGVPVAALRRALLLLASLATAVAVTGGGAVGFVGLVVPHALRLLFGNDQRVLLPACALAGGALLLLADTAARTLVAPQQLPVGVITALVGAPAFIALLLRRPWR